MSESGRQATFIPGYYYVAGTGPGMTRAKRWRMDGVNPDGWNTGTSYTIFAVYTPEDLERREQWARGPIQAEWPDFTIRVQRDKLAQPTFDRYQNR